jgi:hypothetical protein
MSCFISGAHAALLEENKCGFMLSTFGSPIIRRTLFVLSKCFTSCGPLESLLLGSLLLLGYWLLLDLRHLILFH